MSKLEYEIVYLPLKNLSVVWRKAQRAFIEAWAKKIGEEFDPEIFEPIIVTKPNGAGTYHIVEGQHRKVGMEIALGVDQLAPCRIIGEADPARAAKIWLGINKGRKAPRPVTEFLISVEAGEALEVSINKIVKQAGYHVGDQTRMDNNVSAVGALRKIYNAYGGSVVLYTLQTCRLLWGSDPKGVAGNMLTGLGMFLNEFHTYLDSKHLHKVITSQYRSPWKFLDAVRVEAEKSSESMDVSMSELTRMKYNRGRPEGKRLKRKEANE